jgi:hypothetical protein
MLSVYCFHNAFRLIRFVYCTLSSARWRCTFFAAWCLLHLRHSWSAARCLFRARARARTRAHAHTQADRNGMVRRRRRRQPRRRMRCDQPFIWTYGQHQLVFGCGCAFVVCTVVRLHVVGCTAALATACPLNVVCCASSCARRLLPDARCLLRVVVYMCARNVPRFMRLFLHWARLRRVVLLVCCMERVFGCIFTRRPSACNVVT